MNEKSIIKILAVSIAILIAFGATYCWKYYSLSSTIEQAADGRFTTELKSLQQQLATERANYAAAKQSAEAADARAAELERINDRAWELAKQSSSGFIELGTTMAASGTTIKQLIEQQRRIIPLVTELERRNNEIEMGLRSSN